ncbi:ATP-binding cassette sub-family C member 2-like [Dermacentor albipictus]|uniref:ATP-binding cassette sub-family C member 2-like n=1 Tax=Dermacentor albipictus TaxID=60249 RepID=UPI0031FBF272
MDALHAAAIAAQLLKFTPLVIIVLFGGVQTASNNYPKLPRSPYWTLLDVTHMVLLIISSALGVTKACLFLKNTEDKGSYTTSTMLEGVTDIAMALSLVLLALITWRRWRRCLPPSGFIAALLGLLSTACLLEAFQKFTVLFHDKRITLSFNDHLERSIILCFTVAATVTWNFVASELQDLVIRRPTASVRLVDEDSSSLLSRQACTILLPLFKDVNRHGVSATARIPALRRGIRCKGLIQAITARLISCKIVPRSRGSFLLVLLKVLWMDVLWIVLAVVGYYASVFARIPALELLVSSRSLTGITTAALLFAATTACEFLMTCYQMDLQIILAGRTRSIIQGLIFNKVTNMSTESRRRYPAGHITALLSVDTWLSSCSSMSIVLPLIGALLLPFVFWMLGVRTGVGPSLCCAAWTVLVLFLPFLSSFLQKRFWVNVLRARDERLKAIADLLSTIRVVKMYAWEDALLENILRPRNVELKWLFRVNLLDALLDCVYSSTSSVLMIILFSTLYALEPDIVLTPALSFSCVSLLYITDLAMGSGAQALRIFSQAKLSLKRIADFCTAEEFKEAKCDVNNYASATKGTVQLQKCSFSWVKPTHGGSFAQLTDIDLSVEPGALIGVVGFVGSGKSSLLAAILGDMHLIKGDVTCRGRIAFAPQLPVLHNMTIRDNIVYGQSMDAAFYERVVQSCQLMNDFNRMQSGDMTEVGEKGTNLSGGQKQRISIARAVYSQSDVYLLDDPLSSLDPVVASCLFREVISSDGLLRNKTRILVCNQGHYLKEMDKLVLVHGKRIRVYDKLEDLISDPESPQNFREALEQDTPQRGDKSGIAAETLEENYTEGRITQEELGKSTKTAWQVLRSLLRLAQWPAPVSVLIFLGSAGAFGMQQLWIKRWTDASAVHDSAASSASQPPWVGILIALCLADVGFRILGSVLVAFTVKCLSRTLHNDMLSHLVHSPVSFFDATPRGRVLNRFSADVETMEARCFLATKQTIQNTLIIIAKVAIVGTQSPVVVAITLVVGLFSAYILRLALKATNCGRYVESLAMSRLLQHAAETTDALSTVRAYGVAGRLRRHFWHLADDVARGFMCLLSAYRFARTVTATFGFLVVICTLVASIAFAGSLGPDPSSLGLALSNACSVPLSLMSLCLMLFNVLQMNVSFERCLEFAELPAESDAPATQKTEQSLCNWPKEGEIKFQNFSASYNPGVLPDVLRGITFLVKHKEKVGVVGRTGAGKSSLVLALLRMLKASEGRVLIDGVDIADVPLRKLRRSITVIPQDPSMVRGTLRMNLDPTNSHTDEQIWQALEKAHLAKVVVGDVRGLLLEITDGGSNLSVGQRQLVCLARALLRGSKILLLDEATSQMDGDTDRLIQVALREAFAECTLLTVAHRIHTVLDYDRILVLEDGKVREFDSMQTLLSDTSSAFYRMAAECGIYSAGREPDLISTCL